MKLRLTVDIWSPIYALTSIPQHPTLITQQSLMKTSSTDELAQSHRSAPPCMTADSGNGRERYASP